MCSRATTAVCPESSTTRTSGTGPDSTTLMSWRKPSWPEGSRVSTAKPLFGVSRMATGPSALSIIQSPARPRASGPVSDMGGRTIAPRPPPAQALERPETLVSGRDRTRACGVGGSCAGRAAAGEAGAANVEALGSLRPPRRKDPSSPNDALALRKVCRAAQAPRRLSTGRHSRCPSPTRDRVLGRLKGQRGPEEDQPAEQLADQHEQYRDVEEPRGRHGLRDLQGAVDHEGETQRGAGAQESARRQH